MARRPRSPKEAASFVDDALDSRRECASHETFSSADLEHFRSGAVAGDHLRARADHLALEAGSRVPRCDFVQTAMLVSHALYLRLGNTADNATGPEHDGGVGWNAAPVCAVPSVMSLFES